jgi:biotin synthase
MTALPPTALPTAAVPVAARGDAAVAQESPAYVRISTAAALELGLVRGRLAGCTCGCINLLQNYATSCFANCTYCGLARERPGASADKSFIRVDWPLFPTALVAERIAEKEARDTVGRVCVSQVQHPRAYADLVRICAEIHAAAPAVPLSALVSATTLDVPRLAELRATGVDIIGVGLDAATPALFHATRGRGARGPHRWEQHWEIVHAARELYGPMKVNCHVMVGLSETDRDLLELFHDLHGRQIAAYLFSFNPEPATALQDAPRAPIGRWRRIQLVKRLIEHEGLPLEALHFDAHGALLRVDAPGALLDGALADGRAFMTDGCPDRAGEMACNRPYGSYRPSEPFRDYPFRPRPADLADIRRQLALEEIAGGAVPGAVPAANAEGAE